MTKNAPVIDAEVNAPEPPTLSNGWHLVSILFCYVFGAVFTALTGLTFRRSTAFTLLIAPVCGLPSLVLMIAGLLFCKTAIERNPLPFLIAVPFAAAFFWAFIDIYFLGGHFDEVFRLGLFGFLMFPLERRAGFAFFVSAFSGLLYYLHLRDTLERARNKRSALRKMEGL